MHRQVTHRPPETHTHTRARDVTGWASMSRNVDGGSLTDVFDQKNRMNAVSRLLQEFQRHDGKCRIYRTRDSK